MIVGKFPKGSETFLLHQMAGVIDSGFGLKIYASYKGDDEVKHDIIQEYSLLDKVSYCTTPNSRKDILLKGILRTFNSLRHAPAITFRALDISEYGKRSILNIHRVGCVSDSSSEHDIIHAHFGHTGVQYKWWFESISSPVIVSFYGNDASEDIKKDAKKYRTLFSTVDCVTVLSEDMKNKIERAGCPEQKIVKQPLAINTNQFSYKNRKIKDGKIDILTVGRFVEKKGLKYGINALAELSDSHNIHYRIVGDGQLRSELEKQVYNLGIEDSVTFYGFLKQSDVVKHMHESDIFLAPSVTASSGDQEGTPTVILEAQATGLPVVSTNHAGIPEIVKDGESGLLVPERDASSLATALESLITNHERRLHMGEQGRLLVEETHSIPAMKNRLQDLYNALATA